MPLQHGLLYNCVSLCVIRHGWAGLWTVTGSGDADGLAEGVPAGIQTLHQENGGGQPAGARDALCTGQQVCSGERRIVCKHIRISYISDHTQCLMLRYHIWRLLCPTEGFSLLLGLLGTHPSQILLHRLWLPRVSFCFVAALCPHPHLWFLSWPFVWRNVGRTNADAQRDGEGWRACWQTSTIPINPDSIRLSAMVRVVSMGLR